MIQGKTAYSVAGGPRAVGKKERQVLYLTIKRCFDVVLASIMLVLLSPLMLLLFVLIRLSSKGPAIYRHRRVGKGGKPLYILKFRSMVDGADRMIDSFSAVQREEWLQNYRLDDDPRVTRIGRVLRACKMDELPQLVNVIRGELSMVGPRPITEEELKLYGENRDKFLSITPGLTGYWQAYAGNDCSYEERMRMELYYVDNANLLWDIRILLVTVGRVLRCQKTRRS